MSYLSVHLTKAAAYVLMDTGGARPGETAAACFSSKALPIPHLNALFTVRGLSCFETAFLQVVQQASVTNFDDLADRLQEAAEEACRFVEALGDAGLVAGWSDALLDSEIVLIGWSERAGKVQCWVSSSRLDFKPFEVTAPLACAPSFLAPEAVQQAARRMKTPAVDLVSLAKAQHEAAAAVGFIEADGTPCRFGGGMTFFEVNRYGVTSKRLKAVFNDFEEFARAA